MDEDVDAIRAALEHGERSGQSTRTVRTIIEVSAASLRAGWAEAAAEIGRAPEDPDEAAWRHFP